MIIQAMVICDFFGLLHIFLYYKSLSKSEVKKLIYNKTIKNYNYLMSKLIYNVAFYSFTFVLRKCLNPQNLVLFTHIETVFLKNSRLFTKWAIFPQYPCSHLFIGSLRNTCHMLTSQVSLKPHHLTLWLSNRNYNLVFSIWNAICPTLWKPECETLKAEATAPPLGLRLNLGKRRNSSLFAVCLYSRTIALMCLLMYSMHFFS